MFAVVRIIVFKQTDRGIKAYCAVAGVCMGVRGRDGMAGIRDTGVYAILIAGLL